MSSVEPVISVVMPAYNAARYLQESIPSVLNQTIKELELVVVDDGSMDETSEIVSSLDDGRIKYLKNSANQGLIDTLNEGVEASSGKYIARMDADDVCDPRRFELQLRKMAEVNAELCGSALRTFGRRPYLVLNYPERNEDIVFRLLFCTAFAHPTVIGTSKVFKAFPYEKDYVAAEDYRLWTTMAADGVRMTNVADVLLQYRRHDKQESSTKAEQQRRQTERVAREYRESVLGETGVRLNALLSKIQGECTESVLDEAFTLISDIGLLKDVSITEVAHAYRMTSRKAEPMALFVSRVFERHTRKVGVKAARDWLLFAQAVFGLDREGDMYQRLKRWVS